MNRPLALVVLVVVGIGSMTGCGSGFRSNAANAAANFSFSASSPSQLVPVSDKSDSSCFSSSNYDSCIYLKNPVAQSSSLMTTSSDLIQQQTFGIKITDTDTSGFLQNSRLRIASSKGPRVSVFDTRLRKASFSTDASSVEQVMTYYWLNRADQYLSFRLGPLPSVHHLITIYTGAPRTGWAARTNTIQLGDQNHSGLSAEVAISLWGAANASFASSGAISDLSSDVQHNVCLSDQKGCCKSESGCAKAILSGAGDYFALMVFSDQPRIGETLGNNVAGQSICGLSRNVDTFQPLTASRVFSACQDAGWAPALGFLYASIWWEVRKQASRSLEVDQLFMAHLGGLNGQDTFTSAKEKILALAPSFGADLTSLFQTEFARRGL